MNEDKASRYQRLRRRADVASTALTAGLLLTLVLSGGAAVLRTAAEAIAGRPSLLAAVLFVGIVVLLNELLTLPLGYYQGWTLERRYGLSTQSIGRWWIEHAKVAALTLAAALVGGCGIWLLRAWTPEWWWLCAALILVTAMILLTHLAPVLLLPLFDVIIPLRGDALSMRLTALARRAGTGVLGIFEWRLGGRTRRANAALTGLGATRRILLSDTLLANHPDDEIEVILAHELAHHVHHDLWAALALDAALIAASAWLADFVLTHGPLPVTMTGTGDLAALPLIALTIGAALRLAVPLTNALSRAQERRADRYALEMTGNVDAFIRAMRRLAARNLADDWPSPIVKFLFYTHPPVGARIAAAQAWGRQRTAGRTGGRRDRDGGRGTGDSRQ